MIKHLSAAISVCCLSMTLMAGAAVPSSGSDTSAAAINWPRFRGPNGDGQSPESGIPVKWGPSDVAWKTTLKGKGQSSPVIWDDHIYVTSAVDNGRQRLVICLDRKDGKVVWEQVAWTGNPEPSDKRNGWATPSCCTDGQRVYASFGKAGAHCYTANGKHLWSKQLGEFGNKNKRGVAASIVLAGDVVIFNGDSETDPFLFGLNKMTGETIWKVDRPKAEGYSTPILIEVNGRKELVLNGDPYIAGYDPATGKQLWMCKSFKGRGEPMPAYYNGVLYVVNGLAGDVYAVKPGGSGDVTKSHMVWHTPRKEGRDQPAPMVVNDRVIVSNMTGVVTAYDIKSGKILWKDRIAKEGMVYASPVAAEGHLYFPFEDGKIVVLEPGDQAKVLASNVVNPDDSGPWRASPAICRGQIFLRSQDTVYCVGKGQ